MKYEKTNLAKVPLRALGDYTKRNNNIDRGVTLCTRCQGTGNELLSMFRKCQACDGSGESRGNESQFKD
jgi:DnaJ-class molecular chaperone